MADTKERDLERILFNSSVEENPDGFTQLVIEYFRAGNKEKINEILLDFATAKVTCNLDYSHIHTFFDIVDLSFFDKPNIGVRARKTIDRFTFKLRKDIYSPVDLRNWELLKFYLNITSECVTEKGRYISRKMEKSKTIPKIRYLGSKTIDYIGQYLEHTTLIDNREYIKC